MEPTAKRIDQRGTGVSRRARGAAGWLFVLGAVTLGGCYYAVPAQTAYVAPAPVVTPGPVYVAPAPVYVVPGPVYGWGWYGYGWHRRGWR